MSQEVVVAGVFTSGTLGALSKATVHVCDMWSVDKGDPGPVGVDTVPLPSLPKSVGLETGLTSILERRKTAKRPQSLSETDIFGRGWSDGGGDVGSVKHTHPLKRRMHKVFETGSNPATHPHSPGVFGKADAHRLDVRLPN